MFQINFFLKKKNRSRNVIDINDIYFFKQIIQIFCFYKV